MTKWYNPIFFWKMLVKHKSWLDLVYFPVSYQLYIIDYLFDDYVGFDKTIKLRDYINKQLEGKQ